MGVAHLHSSVAGHVAAQFFLIHSAVYVGGQGVVTQVALAPVQRHEGHVGISLGGLLDGVSESIAGHHDDSVALVHSGLDHGHALGGGVTGGLEVVERDTVGLAVSLAGLVGGLVERLVGNVTVVGDHGDAEISGALSGSLAALGGSLLLAAAGNQGQGHHQCKRQSKKLLHWNLPSFKLFDLSMRTDLSLQDSPIISFFTWISINFHICFPFVHIFGQKGKFLTANTGLVRQPFLSISTATPRAISIMRVKVVCRSAGGSSSPVTRLSEMVHMARARLPASAAL